MLQENNGFQQFKPLSADTLSLAVLYLEVRAYPGFNELNHTWLRYEATQLPTIGFDHVIALMCNSELCEIDRFGIYFDQLKVEEILEILRGVAHHELVHSRKPELKYANHIDPLLETKILLLLRSQIQKDSDLYRNFEIGFEEVDNIFIRYGCRAGSTIMEACNRILVASTDNDLVNFSYENFLRDYIEEINETVRSQIDRY